MTNLEMKRLCAEAIGIEVIAGRLAPNGEEFLWIKGTGDSYCPLENDAQMAALVKRFRLEVHWSEDGTECRVLCPWTPDNYYSRGKTLNEAAVECVAKMQAAKS